MYVVGDNRTRKIKSPVIGPQDMIFGGLFGDLTMYVMLRRHQREKIPNVWIGGRTVESEGMGEKPEDRVKAQKKW